MATHLVTESEVTHSVDRVGGGRVGVGLAVLASLLALIAGRLVRWQDVDGYGLISALPTLYWVAIGLGVVATVMLFRAAQQAESRYATAVPMMWLVILHTATQMSHSNARFAIVWTHLGFVRLIEETGAGRLDLDARFAWPGFFGAFVAPIAELPESVLDVAMRLWPTYITGGTAILVAALARRSYPTIPLIGSLSALAYVLLAWTGQDYFSPQSVGYLFYMAILVIIESGPLRSSAAWSSSAPILGRFAAAGGDRPAARSTPAFVSLVILSFGAIVSHPLAPFFICMGLMILGLYGRTIAWRLLLIVGAAYVIWFLISAQPFWQSRIADLVGNFGKPGDVITANTSERVDTSSEARQLVTQTRSIIGLSTFAGVLGIGIAMATERFKHLRPALPLAPLAGIPAMAIALQTYGGEIVIRVLLFTLPMASILLGRLVANLKTSLMPFVVAILAIGLVPVLLISRFGNEEFEMTIEPDRVAIETAYEVAADFSPNDDDTLFVADNNFINWRDEGIGRNLFIEQPFSGGRRFWDECGLGRIEKVREEADLGQVIVVFTNTQTAWNVQGLSLEPSYLDDAAAWLLEREGSEVLHQDDGTWVLRVDTTSAAGAECVTS